MICPKCGSNQIHTTTVTDQKTTSKTKGFGWIKACIGFLLFDTIGILCGLCGMGKGKTKIRTKERVVHICQRCGHRF